jgi:hypothetical protein
MRRLPLLAVGVILAAACSNADLSSGSLSPIASEVLARVDAVLGEDAGPEPGAAEVPEGCRLVIELDEYGFETELVVCEEPAEPSTTVPSGTVPGEPGETTTSSPPDEAPDMAAWVGSQKARDLARRLRPVLIGQSGCAGPHDLIALTNQAAAAPDEIRAPLQEAVAALARSAHLCNVDVAGWQAATETALDHLEQVLEILGDEAAGD